MVADAQDGRLTGRKRHSRKRGVLVPKGRLVRAALVADGQRGRLVARELDACKQRFLVPQGWFLRTAVVAAAQHKCVPHGAVHPRERALQLEVGGPPRPHLERHRDMGQRISFSHTTIVAHVEVGTGLRSSPRRRAVQRHHARWVCVTQKAWLAHHHCAVRCHNSQWVRRHGCRRNGRQCGVVRRHRVARHRVPQRRHGGGVAGVRRVHHVQVVHWWRRPNVVLSGGQG